jgi:membrane protein YdbS with pleckstrin-like domain
VVFICAVLFTVVWWNIDHHRTNWIVMFVFLIVLSAVTGLYAARGILRAVPRLFRRGRSAG